MENEATSIDAQFGTRFAVARKAAGVSQEAVVRVAEQQGVKLHLTAIGKIERGERRVTVGEALALATAIGYTLEGIVGAGESTLVTQGALLNMASNNLQRAVRDYSDALLNFAASADALPAPPRENQQRFLTESMPRQTPAMLSRDAKYAISAAVSRNKIEVGKYVQILIDAVDRDNQALENAHGGSVSDDGASSE